MSNGNSGIDRSHPSRAPSTGVGGPELAPSRAPKKPAAAAPAANIEPDDPKAGRHNAGAANEGVGLHNPRSSGVNTAATTHANHLAQPNKASKAAGAPTGGLPFAPADGPQPDVAVDPSGLEVRLKGSPTEERKPTLLQRLGKKQSNIAGAIAGAGLVGAPVGILVGLICGGPVGAAVGLGIGLVIGAVIGWKLGDKMNVSDEANRILNEDASNHNPVDAETNKHQSPSVPTANLQGAQLTVTPGPDLEVDKKEEAAKLQDKANEKLSSEQTRAPAGGTPPHGQNLASGLAPPTGLDRTSVSSRNREQA